MSSTMKETFCHVCLWILPYLGLPLTFAAYPTPKMTEYEKDLIFQERFTKSKIVPEVIDKVPFYEAEVEFYNGTVELGNDFIIHQLWREPAEILWPIDDFGPYFSLVFLAPDHPDPAKPRFREYLLWLVVNIRGMDIEEGDVIAEYIMPPPPEKKGRQRYVFLILQQRSTGKQKIIEEYIPPCPEDDARANFSTKNFMKKYNFHHIPAAGNFLHVNWGMTV